MYAPICELRAIVAALPAACRTSSRLLSAITRQSLLHPVNSHPSGVTMVTNALQPRITAAAASRKVGSTPVRFQIYVSERPYGPTTGTLARRHGDFGLPCGIDHIRRPNATDDDLCPFPQAHSVRRSFERVVPILGEQQARARG